MGDANSAAPWPPTLLDDVVGAVRTTLGDATRPVQLHEPEFAGNEWAYVKQCIDTGWVSSAGSFVDRFERDLERFTGAAHAVAASSGTAALQVCLRLAGVRPGDEVLLPTLTFIATANAVSYLSATPHFVDSEDVSLGIDASRLEAYLGRIAEVRGGECRNLGTGAVIRALLVMHVFGHPSDLDALAALARRWKLVLVEDAAESLGSTHGDRHTGNVGRLAALSFNGNKVVTTGGGGAILTGDSELARQAKHLTTTARVAHRWSFLHDEVGYNYRLPNLNAALGCAQLERMPSFLARKRRLAQAYRLAFSGLEQVRFLDEPPRTRSNFWLNAVVLARPDLAYRDALLGALSGAGFECRPVWTLMHRLPMYQACPRMDLREAERLEASVINLPSSPKLAGTD